MSPTGLQCVPEGMSASVMRRRPDQSQHGGAGCAAADPATPRRRAANRGRSGRLVHAGVHAARGYRGSVDGQGFATGGAPFIRPRSLVRSQPPLLTRHLPPRPLGPSPKALSRPRGPGPAPCPQRVNPDDAERAQPGHEPAGERDQPPGVTHLVESERGAGVAEGVSPFFSRRTPSRPAMTAIGRPPLGLGVLAPVAAQHAPPRGGIFPPSASRPPAAGPP